MPSVKSAQLDWGALAEPIHTAAVEADDPVWQDTAYLSFWDPLADVFGSVHVCTSPNAPGARRARVSISVAGRVVEVVEALAEGTFAGSAIDFGLEGRVVVDHPAVQAELRTAPLFFAAESRPNPLVSAPVPGRPGGHSQQACGVEGVVRLDGETIATVGHGVRDRTWGFRSEAAQWVEFAALFTVDSSRFVSATKFRGPDGAVSAEGFVIEPQGCKAITGITFARDAAAQLRCARLELADATTRTVSMRSRVGGFWVPAGQVETDGPAVGLYDDFMLLGDEEWCSGGLFEQAVVHRVV
ncbi:hypothetical protein [Nocardia sp. NPDC019395]|uniref:hypothetical protein n=1 Tax=Nocardia sp. NPDC019395 TaxID=3154686 RepID=UPI0033DC0668